MWGPYVEARYYRYYRYECIDLTFCLYRCRYGTGTRYQRGGPQYGPVSGMHVWSHWLLDQAYQELAY